MVVEKIIDFLIFPFFYTFLNININKEEYLKGNNTKNGKKEGIGENGKKLFTLIICRHKSYFAESNYIFYLNQIKKDKSSDFVISYKKTHIYYNCYNFASCSCPQIRNRFLKW